MYGLQLEEESEESADEVELEDVEADDGRFGVWPENWLAVELFIACATKWDSVNLGDGFVMYSGLDDVRVRLVLEMNRKRIGNARLALEDIRLMEAEAKHVVNTRVKKEAQQAAERAKRK